MNVKPFLAALFPAFGISQVSQAAESSRWSLGEGISTVWKIEGSKLPHNDL